jgi:hypothetical protein
MRVAYWLIAIGLLLLSFGLGGLAKAHDHTMTQYTPKERSWFEQQRVPVDDRNTGGGGAACCSLNDGDFVEEDIRDGKYWIRCALDSPCPLKEWTEVPDEKVIKEPNKLGRSAVWWDQQRVNGSPVGPYQVRCFAPGALL